jgi:hypothetical protein
VLVPRTSAASPGVITRRGRARGGRHHVRGGGHRGHPRYGWTGSGTTDRNFAAGLGSGTTVTADAATKTGPWVTQRDFDKSYESVDWSQARYDDYGFVALDVTPAPRGARTTMTLRFINEPGRELDRVVFTRTAGEVLDHPYGPVLRSPAHLAPNSRVAGTCLTSARVPERQPGAAPDAPAGNHCVISGFVFRTFRRTLI